MRAMRHYLEEVFYPETVIIVMIVITTGYLFEEKIYFTTDFFFKSWAPEIIKTHSGVLSHLTLLVKEAGWGASGLMETGGQRVSCLLLCLESLTEPLACSGQSINIYQVI